MATTNTREKTMMNREDRVDLAYDAAEAAVPAADRDYDDAALRGRLKHSPARYMVHVEDLAEKAAEGCADLDGYDKRTRTMARRFFPAMYRLAYDWRWRERDGRLEGDDPLPLYPAPSGLIDCNTMAQGMASSFEALALGEYLKAPLDTLDWGDDTDDDE